jgi:lysophospholipase L1-like esterase
MGLDAAAGVAPRRRGDRLFGIALAAALAIVAGLVLREYTWVVPRRLQRQVAGWFLQAMLVAHGLMLVLVPLGLLVFGAVVLRGRQRRARRPLAARLVLVCGSCGLGLLLAEATAIAWQAWVHRMPVLPVRFANGPRPLHPMPVLPVEFAATEDQATDAVEILVIGESSAQGVPFFELHGDPHHPEGPWLSIGQIVAWQLERAIPGRRFHLEIMAVAGAALEQEHHWMVYITRRPDVVIIYAGHNEFAARFHGDRIVPEEGPPTSPRDRFGFLRRLDVSTPLRRMLREASARNGVDVAPAPKVLHGVVDWPVCSRAEYDEIRTDFHRRLEAIVAYCERLGALPILVKPPGNDAGYEPNRSVAGGPITREHAAAIAREFLAARAAEGSDPVRAEALYRAFLARQPQFAEAHFRLARLLEHAGGFDEAYRHYVLARDLDGYPQRCPSDLQAAYDAVAARHPGAIHIDGQALFRARSPHGMLDDHLFHDGVHPVLAGHVALAQAALEALHARRAFGWPEHAPAPVIDLAECAAHFGMTPKRWATVCEVSELYYSRTAHLRQDNRDRLDKAERYRQAARALAAGVPPEQTGIPGLGVRPVLSTVTIRAVPSRDGGRAETAGPTPSDPGDRDRSH